MNLKKTADNLKIKTSHYIIAGFSLVVGLSWNDTIKHAINTYFPLTSDAILMKVIYYRKVL